MTPFLLSFLLLSTIIVAFIFGISLGYWAVCGILYFFSPERTHKESTPTPSFAHSSSGD